MCYKSKEEILGVENDSYISPHSVHYTRTKYATMMIRWGILIIFIIAVSQQHL